MSQGLLNGVRVLDLSRLLPGGYCTQLLADLGAEVIKVETPRLGDYARLAPPEFGGPAVFEVVNQGKKSVALNYRNQRGREVFLKLAEGVDAILENFRPGLATRYGIDYPAVKAINPRVVYCSLSGYGQTGPYRDRAGHDLNYLSVGGLLDINGTADGPPIPPAVQIADLSAGMLAAIAMLGALVGRQASGEGAYLDVSMLDAVVSWMLPLVEPLFSLTGEDPRRGRMPLSGGLPCFNVYRTADGGYLSLAALEPPLWSTFCKTLGREDLLGRQFESQIVPVVAGIFQGAPLADWLARFEGLEVCLEPVSTYSQMLAHPQVQARGLVREGSGGSGVRANSPFAFAPRPVDAAAPELGEHTGEILEEAGILHTEIQALAEQGVVRLGRPLQ